MHGPDPFAGLDAEALAAAIEQRQPRFIPPMLATLTDRRFDDPSWIYEWKLDGERCLAHRDGDEVRLWSRNEKRIDGSYPEIVEAMAGLGLDDVVLDGEVVVLVDGDQTSFELLQHRMQISDPDEARATGIPVTYFVFDVLHVAGRTITPLTLEHRKAVLDNLRGGGRSLDPAATIRVVEPVRGKGIEYYQQACERRWEGVIAKDLAAPYESGKRSRRWLKFKCVWEQELVIGGFTDPQGSRVGFGALLVGYYDQNGHLHYAGKVGTGFDTETLLSLREKLDELERPDPPFVDDEELPRRGVHWVEPVLVAQVGFTEWTETGKLRHPRFLGLRRDKDPREVVREVPE